MEALSNKAYRTYDYISRYAAFPYFYNKNDDRYVYGTTAQLRDSTSYSLHTVQRNETYDSIALYYYNNPTLYWVICDFNRIQDPFNEPEVGSKLKIPSISSIVFDI